VVKEGRVKSRKVRNFMVEDRGRGGKSKIKEGKAL